MWRYMLGGAVVTAVFSVSLPFAGASEATLLTLDRLGLYLAPASAMVFAMGLLPRRAKPVETPDLEQAEFVGNTPPAWNIRFTADLATMQRRAGRTSRAAPRPAGRLATDAAPKGFQPGARGLLPGAGGAA